MSEQIFKSLSPERLSVYKKDGDNSPEAIIKRYALNLRMSEALYPAISLFEVGLRNHITNAIHKNIKNNWLIEELKNPTILLQEDYKQLCEVAKKLPECKRNNDGVLILPEKCNGKLIAGLTLGFWVHLFNSAYNPNLWLKPITIFDDVFPNFDEALNKAWNIKNPLKRVNKMYAALRLILKLRNRIFHNEPIFNMPEGIENIYTDINSVVLAMSEDLSELLEECCTFDKFKHLR